MTIGIIGPKLSCEKIAKDLQVISPETNTISYVREASADAIEVIRQCEEECDAIIFTGSGPYTSVMNRYHVKKPYEHIPKDSVSLQKVLNDMKNAGYELNHFSIDVAKSHTIKDVFSEMELNPSDVYSFPFESYDEMEYIAWHQNLWDRKKIKTILTGFVRIYHYFKEKGYPVFYLPITRSTVRNVFEKLQSRLALKEAHASQIAVEIFRLNMAAENSKNYYSNMLKKGKAESYIIHYAQEIQASFFRYGREEYVIFSNKGSVKDTYNYRRLYELQKKISTVGFQLNIGIGTSMTAYQSESNARRALAYSLNSKDNYFFLIKENDTLVGPLGQEQELSYELSSSSQQIQKISEDTEMSPSSITKIMSIMKVRKNNIFDAVTLSDCLQISPRSARRILNKLIETGYAQIYAKEGQAGGGRPRHLVEIKF